MRAEVIAVGTELLIGQIANTNAQYISKELNSLGISVYFHQVVGDNRDRMKKVFNIAFDRSDVIIVTGGLGPTEDDITKETICELLDIPLETNEKILQNIKSYFKDRERMMADSNVKQAMIPQGAHILNNLKGTAPGIYINRENRHIVLLPGPPIEMKPMFKDFVKKYLKTENVIYSKYVNIFGIGESEVESRIKDLIHKDPNVTLATYASLGQVTIRITTIAKTASKGEEILKETVEELKRRFGENVFSDKDITLPIKVSRLLYENNLTVSFAESCTGGLISKIMTDLPGASSIYMGSIIAYSEEIKRRILNVRKETLKKYGAVSKETCREMATNVREITKADYGVAITGIAGPTGGTDEKPVGTVFIGISDRKDVKIRKLQLYGDRNKVRNITAMTALDILRREIKEFGKEK